MHNSVRIIALVGLLFVMIYGLSPAQDGKPAVLLRPYRKLCDREQCYLCSLSQPRYALPNVIGRLEISPARKDFCQAEPRCQCAEWLKSASFCHICRNRQRIRLTRRTLFR